MSDRIWSDMGDGARDVAGHALTDIQNQYQQALTGRLAPMTSMPGVMETTTETSEPLTGPPESYSTALIKHAAAEGAQHEAEHWRDYATRDTSAPDIEPGVSGWERYSATFHGAGPASPSASAPQAEQEQEHEPEL
jgi:hypothetical protein